MVNPGNAFHQFISEMLNEINSIITQKKWTDDEIRNKYALRGASQIISDGDVFYMNSCPDYSLLFYHFLKKKNTNPRLIIQELYYKTLARKVYHFAVGFDYMNTECYVETLGFNQVALGFGEYTGNRENVDNLGITILENEIEEDINIIESTTGRLKDQFNEFRKEHIGYLIKSNTTEAFTAFARKVGDLKLSLIVG